MRKAFRLLTVHLVPNYEEISYKAKSIATNTPEPCAALYAESRAFRSYAMAEDENQRLIFKKLYAQCPCGGRINLGRAPKGTIEPSIGRCDKNPLQHTFTFDKTTRFGAFW